MKEGFVESVFKCYQYTFSAYQIGVEERNWYYTSSNGGGSKKFLHLLRGVQKVLAACEGGVKKFDNKNFQLPSPPHQSINEHSLRSNQCSQLSLFVIQNVKIINGFFMFCKQRLDANVRVWL